MVSEESTQKILKELRQAGFVHVRTTGSHSRWEHGSGIAVTVPDGHRRISPGVVRKVRKAIQEAQSL